MKEADKKSVLIRRIRGNPRAIDGTRINTDAADIRGLIVLFPKFAQI